MGYRTLARMPRQKNGFHQMDKMRTIDRIIFAIFLLMSNLAMSQNKNGRPDIEVVTIKQLYHIADTLNWNNTSVTMKVLWMHSVVEVRKTTSLKYDLEYARKFRRDSTFVPTQKDTLRYNERRRIGSQNCHSYALEKYFTCHKIVDNDLFTSMTVLTENKYMEKILMTAFKKVTTIQTKPRKNLKYSFTKGSILVFRNKWNVPIHTVFYDGEFHSKYGGWGAKAEKKLKPVFDRYWDTTTIEEFQLDTHKIEKYLTRGTD